MRRWDELSRFRIEASITGAIWALKGKPSPLTDVVLEGETPDQRLKIRPFPWPGRCATWEPYRQTIETIDGLLVAERRDPAASFVGLTGPSPWDDMQVAYFAGEATWNYLVAPFVCARADFTVEEAEPWTEDGQDWRRLDVPHCNRCSHPPADVLLRQRRAPEAARLLRRRPRPPPRCALPVGLCHLRRGRGASTAKGLPPQSRWKRGQRIRVRRDRYRPRCVQLSFPPPF
jgi:hypothetical protein